MPVVGQVIVLVLCGLGSISPASGELRFSNVFGSHMVLQRGKPAPIWGWDTPGAEVTVVFAGQTYPTIAAGSGLWKVTLPAQAATLAKQVITASSNSTSIALRDVLFGEVLFCSGQSNMEFTASSAVNATAEIAAADGYPNIRVFSGPEQNIDTLNGPGFNVSHDELLYTRLNWSIASAQSIGCVDGSCHGWDYFSAVCWFAARDLHDTLGGTVPIGAVSQNYGGTSIQFWMSPDSIEATAAPVATQCCGQDGGPSCLWNTQVHPYTIGPMQFSTAIWYQGEQNANCGGPTQVAGAVYSTMLQAMVEDWRLKLGNPDMAFGAVLLAAWKAGDPISFPLLRLAQANLTAHVPKTFLISAIDRGDPHSGAVHSPYKQDVGRRAAMGTAAVALGLPIKYMAPQFANQSTPPGASPGEVTVTFGSGGLVINKSVSCPPVAAGSCESFAVMDSACRWHPADATLGPTDSTLVLQGLNWTAGNTPTATRGYFANWPVVTVTNADGLPLTPWMEYVGSGSSSSCPLTPSPPPPPGPKKPCDSTSTAAPPGFTGPQLGWFHGYTLISQGTGGSVEDCAAVCDKLTGNRYGGAKCSGFHVWKPCAAGDCYVYLNGTAGFSPHASSFAYIRVP